MARRFEDVFVAIANELSPELRKQLVMDYFWWAPEICWEKLSYWVNYHVEPQSSNSKSIKIYSILCDCTEDEMRKRFKEQGF